MQIQVLFVLGCVVVDGSQAACPDNKVLVPIQYKYKGPDAQASWLYSRLNPRLAIQGIDNNPVNSSFSEGAMSIDFCIPLMADWSNALLKVGPRQHQVVNRPHYKDGAGTLRMSTIFLVDQPNPDWVVVKSIERIQPQGSRLPSFDVELVNFGRVHSGGRVQFKAERLGVRCSVGSPVSRARVSVALSGKKLRILSSDPDYPEELIARDVELVTNIDSCSSNYSLRVDFGQTGQLLPGSNRIRYSLTFVSGKDGATLSNGLSVDEFFSQRPFKVDIVGEGIW